jgi:hypothetical protein
MEFLRPVFASGIFRSGKILRLTAVPDWLLDEIPIFETVFDDRFWGTVFLVNDPLRIMGCAAGPSAFMVTT